MHRRTFHRLKLQIIRDILETVQRPTFRHSDRMDCERRVDAARRWAGRIPSRKQSREMYEAVGRAITEWDRMLRRRFQAPHGDVAAAYARLEDQQRTSLAGLAPGDPQFVIVQNRIDALVRQRDVHLAGH